MAKVEVLTPCVMARPLVSGLDAAGGQTGRQGQRTEQAVLSPVVKGGFRSDVFLRRMATFFSGWVGGCGIEARYPISPLVIMVPVSVPPWAPITIRQPAVFGRRSIAG